MSTPSAPLFPAGYESDTMKTATLEHKGGSFLAVHNGQAKAPALLFFRRHNPRATNADFWQYQGPLSENPILPAWARYRLSKRLDEA